MDNCFQFWYNMEHETSRNPQAAGEKPATGHPVAESGQEPVGSGARRKCFPQFGIAMAPGVPGRGMARVADSTDSRASAQAFSLTDEKAGEGAPEGASLCRVSDGAV